MDESRPSEWWRSAVVYQVYPRSFADANGDGIGDIGGIRARLSYLADLGVDALWITPMYPSPMADAGYDVADPRGIDPVFGDVAQAKALFDEAHDVGLRVLIDLVPNHFSDQHRWFQEALRSEPGSRARQRFHFRDGRGPDGAEPPTDWVSDFGGGAWSRTTDADGRPGQWYLHFYAPEQPDVNWADEDVVADFDQTLRYWFDLGVDGFRVDVAHGLAKDPHYTDTAGLAWPLPPDTPEGVEHPHWDRPEVHDIYRRWRTIADSYDPPRVFAGEVWVGRAHRLARYVRQDEFHTAFNFDYLICPWRATVLRRTIEDTLACHAEVGAPPTWVLSNHDVPREVSRYARPQPDHPIRLFLDDLLPHPPDLALGRRRARAAALLMLALPGSAYVYQGGELGLPEVEDIPDDQLQDPVFRQTRGAARGRDGCRVPLPWSGSEPPFSFSPPGSADPWLPQPADWAELTVDAQSKRPESTLSLYRSALRLRRSLPALGDGSMWWHDASADVLHLCREPGFACLVNLASDALPLPAHARILLISDPLDDDGRLPPDTAAWLAT